MDLNKVISVSVVIPCFRCSATIERAVISVLTQTIKPAELILVDDNSNDGTLLVLQSIRQRYGSDYIKILSLSQNCGASVARNKGWEQCCHDYIAFLDADDAWHPRKIEIQYHWMQRHPDVALSGHKCVILNSVPIMPFINTDFQFKARYLSQKKILIFNPFVTPSFMLKRDLPYRFDPSSRYTEDYFLLMQLSFGGFSIAVLEVELVYVFKQLGVSGLSGNLFMMRFGDLKNYWKLWQLGKLNFLNMFILMMYSSLKYFILLSFGPKVHQSLRKWIYNS